MRIYFLLILSTFLIGCSSNDEVRGSDIESSHEVVIVDGNKLVKKYEGELIYKVKIIEPNGKFEQSNTKEFLSTFNDIHDVEKIQLITKLQKRAMNRKYYFGGPYFIHFVIKNELTYGKLMHFYISKTDNNSFFIFYFVGGFKAAKISREEVEELIKGVQKDPRIKAEQYI